MCNDFPFWGIYCANILLSLLVSRSRYAKGIIWTSDFDQYKSKDFTVTASNIRAEMIKVRELMMIKKD